MNKELWMQASVALVAAVAAALAVGRRAAGVAEDMPAPEPIAAP